MLQGNTVFYGAFSIDQPMMLIIGDVLKILQNVADEG